MLFIFDLVLRCWRFIGSLGRAISDFLHGACVPGLWSRWQLFWGRETCCSTGVFWRKLAHCSLWTLQALRLSSQTGACIFLGNGWGMQGLSMGLIRCSLHARCWLPLLPQVPLQSSISAGQPARSIRGRRMATCPVHLHSSPAVSPSQHPFWRQGDITPDHPP